MLPRQQHQLHAFFPRQHVKQHVAEEPCSTFSFLLITPTFPSVRFFPFDFKFDGNPTQYLRTAAFVCASSSTSRLRVR